MSYNSQGGPRNWPSDGLPADRNYGYSRLVHYRKAQRAMHLARWVRLVSEVKVRSKRKIKRPWRPSQRLKNTLLYLFMRGGFFVIERLPSHGFFRLVGSLSPYIFRRETRRAHEHLRTSMPHLDAAETTRRMFVHLSESIWELARLRRQVVDLDGPSRRVFDDALAEGKGVIVISGHVGNWELLGQAIVDAGYPLSITATPHYDPRLTRWLDQWRAQRGLKIIWSGQNSGKAILSVLRSNQLMGFLLDQNTRTEGEYVPFFGRPAFTPTTPAALALRTGAPVIFCWHHRRSRSHQFTVERVDYEKTGDHRRDILALTTLLTARLEKVIRAAPEQWVWMHRRWRIWARAAAMKSEAGEATAGRPVATERP